MQFTNSYNSLDDSLSSNSEVCVAKFPSSGKLLHHHFAHSFVSLHHPLAILYHPQRIPILILIQSHNLIPILIPIPSPGPDTDLNANVNTATGTVFNVIFATCIYSLVTTSKLLYLVLIPAQYQHNNPGKREDNQMSKPTGTGTRYRYLYWYTSTCPKTKSQCMSVPVHIENHQHKYLKTNSLLKYRISAYQAVFL